MGGFGSGQRGGKDCTGDMRQVDVRRLQRDGYLKPGVAFKSDGTLVSGASQTIYGVVIEPLQIPGQTTNSGLSSNTSDPIIALGVMGIINRDIAEDNLGRAYSANEISAFAAAGSLVKLTPT